MRVRIVACGKLKKAYVSEGVRDYSGRLSKYCRIEIAEVKDERTGESEPEIELSKNKEGERLLSAISKDSLVVCLDMRGEKLSTEQFAEFLRNKKMERVKELVFVIGGSGGLSKDVLRRADYTLSFSSMTFPHGLMRLILLEQLYRAEKILSGEPYHK